MRILLEVLIGLVVLAVTIFAGYRCWPFQQRLEKLHGGAARKRLAIPASIVPLLLGSVSGLVMIALLSGMIVPGDKFYDRATVISSATAMAVGAVIVAFGPFVMLTSMLLMAGLRPGARNDDARQKLLHCARWTWLTYLIPELIAAWLVTASGIRFNVLGFVPEHPAHELGALAPYLTVVWILVATSIIKLLTGIEGASNVLLLVAASAVLWVTIGAREYYLSAFAVVLMAAALGSLRFNFFPARLPLGISGNSCIGFIFATLTVMARQKTVTALLVVFPVLVLVILIGGSMLLLLERTMSAGSETGE